MILFLELVNYNRLTPLLFCSQFLQQRHAQKELSHSLYKRSTTFGQFDYFIQVDACAWLIQIFSNGLKAGWKSLRVVK